jgi:TetR/AcrR family transcriptional repressor of mexJK operon
MNQGRFASFLRPGPVSCPPPTALAARGARMRPLEPRRRATGKGALPGDMPLEDMPIVVARRGGRPSRLETAQLQETILDVATELFLTRGFGATSIEAVAAGARISKRTFYHRFSDKAALFEAVVRRLIDRWLPPFEAQLREAGSLEALLRGLAGQILAVALSPPALALHRLLIAESQRFPELVRLVNEAGAGKGVERIAALLEREAQAGNLVADDSRFLAEQFLNMVLSVPQKRALGFGQPLSGEALARWTDRTVALFVDGCRQSGAASWRGR